VHRKLIITNSKKMKLKGFAIFLLSFFYAVTTVNAQETPSYKTTQFIKFVFKKSLKTNRMHLFLTRTRVGSA